MFTLGRQREKQHAASFIRNEEDRLIAERVIDAVHDIAEGVASVDVVAPILADAFVTGGSGVWEQTGSWLRKLTKTHPSLAEVWPQLAIHKSSRIRFRVAAFVNDVPPSVRRQLVTQFLADPSAKVRSKVAGEICMNPTPDMLPLLNDRVVQERDAEVLGAIREAINLILPAG
jgi:hypothetical protein